MSFLVLCILHHCITRSPTAIMYTGVHKKRTPLHEVRKVNFTLEQDMKTQKRKTDSLSSALFGGVGVKATHRQLYPEKTRYPVHMRLWGAQGRPGQVRKISPQQGFDPRKVQTVASSYAGYDIPFATTSLRCTTNLKMTYTCRNMYYDHLLLQLL
jgi:hypothetical protein